MRKKEPFIPFCPKGLAILPLALWLTGGHALPAHAEASLAMRGGVHETFDRVVFDWPRATPYQISRNGSEVQISFQGGAQPDLAALSRAKIGRAKEFTILEKSDNALVVRFKIGDKAELKDFLSGNAVVLDITDPMPDKKTAEKAEKKAAAPAEAQPKAATQPPKAAPAPKTEPLTPPPPIAVPTKAPPAAAPVPEPPAAKEEPSVKAEASAETAALSPFKDIGASSELILSLDPGTEVGAAVFARGGYGYVIFDRKIATDFKTLTAKQATRRLTPDSIDLPQNNGFRFPLPEDIDLRVTHDGTAWQIFASRQVRGTSVNRSFTAQPDFALGARLLLPTVNPPEPVRFSDPVVGDEIIVVPLRQSDSFPSLRRYAEMEVLPSAQGLVIRPLVDKLIVHKVSDGIEVTRAGGLLLSPAADSGVLTESFEKNQPPIKRLFDLAAWRGKPGETFFQTQQRLLATIVNAMDNQRNRIRLELARLFFAHGMGEETLGILQYLAASDPDLKNYPEFQALNGAAKILAGRLGDGAADLSQGDLKLQTESQLWQAAADMQQHNWAPAEEKFRNAKDLLFNYEEPFYSKFVVLAIESALAADNDREAANWLTEVDMRPHLASINGALDYLHGVIHSKAGRTAVAEDFWKKAAASRDRLYQVRANLALIDLGVAMHSLTPAQAADRLEVLKYAWRGDELEFDILHRLGLFYLESGNLKAGLAALADAVRLYPSSPVVGSVHEEMAQAFRTAFLERDKKPLSPLDALGIYQTYGDLMPAGEARNGIIESLAEQLVAIDLLDQAADLLEGLVKTSLQGEERAKIGTRLAAIRLLDHKAEAALTALAYGASEPISAELTEQRLLMKARSLSELDKPDEALALLQKDASNPGKLLRANINMRAKRWSEAAKSLLDLVGPPPQGGATLSAEQSRYLVNCAVALSLAGDTTGLDRLAIDYGPVLANVPQNDAFRILTRPEKIGQPRNLAGAQAKIAEVDLFRGFLDAFRGPGEKIETKIGK